MFSFFIFSFNFLSLSCWSSLVLIAVLVFPLISLVALVLFPIALDVKDEPNALAPDTEVPEVEDAVDAEAFKFTLAKGFDDDDDVVNSEEATEE